MDKIAYLSFIKAPVEKSLILPANGDFAVSNVAGKAKGSLAVTAKAFKIRQLISAYDDKRLQQVGWFEKGVKLVVADGFELYLHLGLGVYKKIAQSALTSLFWQRTSFWAAPIFWK